MELKEIQFANYKSIQKRQTIKLDSPIIALTGKNGSGKTNALDALYFAFSQNATYPFTEPDGFQYKFVLELSDEEFNLFCNDIEVSDNNKFIEIGNDGKGDSLRPKYIKSKEIVKTIQAKYGDLQKILESLLSNLKKYADSLEQFATNTRQNDIELGTIDFSLFTDYPVWTGTDFESQLKRILTDAEKLYTALIKDDDTLNFINQQPPLLTGICKQLKNLKLNTRPLNLSPFQRKVIQIDEDAVKVQVEKVNIYLSELAKKIIADAESFEKYCDEIDVLNKEHSETEDEESSHINSLRDSINQCIGKKVYYLQNFTSAMFFCPKNEGYSNRNAASYIISAYKRFCNIQETEEQVLDQTHLKDFNKALNKAIPNFDANMIEEIEAEQNGNDIQIYFKEKSGTRINLNDSNLGRRWYFTYFFYKSCLEKGDIFLIDEPAAFLHPDAQNEIFEDLKELAENGIKVIYSTHSPYLIPQNMKSLRILTLNKNGTEIQELTDEENQLDELKERIGIMSVNDLLLRFGKPIVFVEGYHDKKCLEKFIEFFQIETDIEIYICFGSPVVRTAWIAMKLGLKDFKLLLDNDNKTKLKNSSGNINFENELKDLEEANKVVYISKDENKKEIEDLFEGEDREKYLHKIKGKNHKVNPSALKKATDFSDETLQNFKYVLTDLGILKANSSI